MRGAAGWRTVVCLVLLCALHPARGAGLPWYAVEVLIFEQGGDAAASEEASSATRPPALPEGTVELLPAFDAEAESAAAGRRHAFRMLPESSFRLRATAARLERTGEYRVILHVAWHQPGFPRNEAPAVHIGTAQGLALGERFAGDAGVAIDGTIRLWRRRFPHIEADLWYGQRQALRRQPAPGPIEGMGGAAGDEDRPAPHAGGPPLTRLVESRRLRGKELHYLDHPRVGVLVQALRL